MNGRRTRGEKSGGGRNRGGWLIWCQFFDPILGLWELMQKSTKDSQEEKRHSPKISIWIESLFSLIPKTGYWFESISSCFYIPDISHLPEEDVIRRGGAICLPVATNSLFMGFVIGIIGNYSSTMKIGWENKIVTLHPLNYSQCLWFYLSEIHKISSQMLNLILNISNLFQTCSTALMGTYPECRYTVKIYCLHDCSLISEFSGLGNYYGS